MSPDVPEQCGEKTPTVDTRMALGRQLTLECYDCDSEILADAQRMERVFLEAARVSGATIISSHFHAFEPQGVSGVVIISESHFAVHAWPEHDYAAVDIFTCGDSIDFKKAAESIQQGLGSSHAIVSSMMNRGIVNNQGIERMVTVCEDRAAHYSLSWRKRYEATEANGISVTIDVYDCPLDSVVPGQAAMAWTEELVRSDRLERFGKMHSYSASEGMIALRQDFVDGTWSMHINLLDRTVYADLFVAHYIDPRDAAEALLRCFSGRHYRMQIAIRQ